MQVALRYQEEPMNHSYVSLLKCVALRKMDRHRPAWHVAAFLLAECSKQVMAA